MLSLIDAMKTSTTSSVISLPEFNPEAALCNTVDMCLSEKLLQGSALIITLIAALKGNASQWFSQVSYAAGMQ